MEEERICYTPIGVIRSPFTIREDMPIQPSGARGVSGRIELKEEFAEGLNDIDGFSHLYLLYHFHQSSGYCLKVTPFLDKTPRGLFATRAPKRPNPIGLSVVRLEKIEGSTIHILDVDVLDGTPLLDLKPYVPAFDVPADKDVRTGWVDNSAMRPEDIRADGRFK
ncbi:MAG: tRNA (N6-threonylcarbamoyladenosine(37)-N6)-methyltransferase TrmO [Desulfobacterales bacterium]|nr:tRNA (N6-threonylcarbamoyladenosine(37)-N6)-methyltransferase TrmO [Desulfobacterales bacterium]